MSAELLECMPARSTCVLYGSMRETGLEGFDPLLLIGRGYTLDSFILGEYLASKGLTGILPVINRATALMNDSTLQSTVQKKLSFSEFQNGIKDYYKNMTAGKFILNPFAVDEALDNAEPMDEVFNAFDIKGLTSE